MNSKKKSENPEVTLKEKLMSASQEKLADMLISLYDNNIDLQKQLDIMFASLEGDPKKIRSMIKKEISSLRRSTRFIDYRESDAFTNRLDFIASKIVDDLNVRSPKMAFDTMLELMDLHGKILERCDDSNGSIGGSFSSMCKDLGNIALHVTDLLLEGIVEVVFAKFMGDEYGIYGNIIRDFKDVLKKDGLDLLQKKLEAKVNNQNKYEYRITTGLQAIADCRNNVDDFIKACSLSGKPNLREQLEIAKRLISHEQGKEALKWLDNEELSHINWRRDTKRLKIEALELEGEYKKAQEERLSWFAEDLSPDLYGEILKYYAKPDFKESFKSDAIKKAFQFKDADSALHFLMKIQEFEEGAKLVRLRSNEFSGEQYYTLRPAAELLKAFDPIAATLLYRKLAQPVLEKAKHKYYNYGAKDLATCTMLNLQITDWGDIQNHDQYFQDIEINHKRKSSFWSAYKSALQKQIAKKAKSKA